MFFSLLLFLPALGLVAEARESYAPLPTISFHRKRQQMTCSQTYGNGSMPCGGADSRWCFNPNLGQSCCLLDMGFCGKGSYCAPVAGYCCLEGEDLASCADNAGFVLPSSTIQTVGAVLTTSAEISRNITVTPFIPASPAPTPMRTPEPDKALLATGTVPGAVPGTVAGPVAKPAGDLSACTQAPSKPIAVQAVQVASNTTIPAVFQPALSSHSVFVMPSVQPTMVRVSAAVKRHDGGLAISIVMVVMGGLLAIL